MQSASLNGTEYIRRIRTIWELNDPPLSAIRNGVGLYSAFRSQYHYVRLLSSKNQKFTGEVLLPLLDSAHQLSKEEEQLIRDLSDQLIELDDLKLTDFILSMKLNEKLLSEAMTRRDHQEALHLTCILVRLLYHMCDLFRREMTKDSIRLQDHYKEIAINHIEDLKPWTELTAFSSLTTEEKNDLIALLRMESLFIYPDFDNIEARFHERLSLARKALAFTRNEEYRNLNPDVDWETEEGAALYYVTICGSIIFRGDPCRPEDLTMLDTACMQQLERIKNGKPSYSDLFETGQMVSFMQYLKGEITPETYISIISADYRKRNPNRYDLQGINENVYRPAQILEVLYRHLENPENAQMMQQIIKDLAQYSLHIPNNEYQELFLVYTLISLHSFKETDGGILFSSLCKTLLANCSPATFVHSQMVGRIAKLMGMSLASSNPDVFIGLCGITCAEDTKDHLDEIGDLLYHCGLFHDMGKLPYLDTIGITYRPLFPEEFDIIRLHPSAGYSLLQKHPSTAIYADAALLHHKWYNDTGGYPSWCSRSKAAHPILVDIIAVADCLDAATDIIFRSYSKGIAIDDFIAEAKAGAGTRYSPVATAVFNDAAMMGELRTLMTVGRDQAYINAYQRIHLPDRVSISQSIKKDV